MCRPRSKDNITRLNEKSRKRERVNEILSEDVLQRELLLTGVMRGGVFDSVSVALPRLKSQSFAGDAYV